MTLINVDLRNVAGETGRHDKVVFHAPVHREGSAGQTIQTAPVIVDLEGGIGSVDLDPGPVVVEIRARGWEDTAPKTVMVPEEGPITLTDLLQQAFTYTPAVVSRSLAQITTARDDALADVGGAVDQALAGSQRYSGTGFPNGSVAAPVGSIYTDTSATAGAIRWIKTSGAGNTGWKVEYGDTGWRDITSLIPEVTSGTVRVMRKNGIAYLSFTATVFSTTSSGLNISRMIPSGFRIDDTGFAYFPFARDLSPQPTTLRLDRFGHAYLYNVQGTSASGTFSWPASTWPTALPGTPA